MLPADLLNQSASKFITTIGHFERWRKEGVTHSPDTQNCRANDGQTSSSSIHCISASKWRQPFSLTPAQLSLRECQKNASNDFAPATYRGQPLDSSSTVPKPIWQHDRQDSIADTMPLTTVNSTSAMSMLSRFQSRSFYPTRRHLSTPATTEHSQRKLDRHTLHQARTCLATRTAQHTYPVWLRQILSFWQSISGTRPRLPSDAQLTAVAIHAFPPRMSLPVLICNVTATNGYVVTSTVGEIERCMAPSLLLTVSYSIADIRRLERKGPKGHF